MVFQSFNLFAHLTVMDNLMLAQKIIRKRSPEEARKIAHGFAEKSGHTGKNQCLSFTDFRRATAKGGHRPGAGHESAHHAVR